jgi:hypothetical protein
LKILTTVEFMVLAVVSVAFFAFPGVAAPQWAWEFTPFNVRFTGAVYLASAVAVGAMLFAGRWAPARLILPMILTFTGLVLLATLLQLDNFIYDRPATWGWFILYIVLPVNAAVHLYIYREQPPALARKTPARWSQLATWAAPLLALYGAGLFMAPAAFTVFWPWPVNAFHAFLYSAIFITAGLGLWLVRTQAAAIELRSLGATLLTLGAFALVGLALANVVKPIVVWSAPGTLAWLAIMAVIGGIGAGLLRLAARTK